MNPSPVRVLCLHGCNQTEEMFRSLLKGLIKIAGKTKLEFHFIEAQYSHSLGGKTWYSEELDVSQIPIGIPFSTMVQSCMAQVHKYVTEHQIDVLLGFSQGGNVVDTYLRRYDETRIKRAVIFSGYELVRAETERSLQTPLLNVYSDADTVVPSKCCPKHYQTIYSLSHDKGHKLPTSNPVLRQICRFMEQGTWETTT